jgi:crossover junction endodeoxyribonuclease RusA
MAEWKIPVPPSANNLFINRPGGGRAKSPAYRKWIEEAGWRLREQLAQPVAGKTFSLTIYAPVNRQRDISNVIKATEDLLVSMGLIPVDDRYIDYIEVRRIGGQEEMTVMLAALT